MFSFGISLDLHYLCSRETLNDENYDCKTREVEAEEAATEQATGSGGTETADGEHLDGESGLVLTNKKRKKEE